MQPVMCLMEGTAQVRQVVGQLGGWVLSTQGLLSPNQGRTFMIITQITFEKEKGGALCCALRSFDTHWFGGFVLFPG